MPKIKQKSGKGKNVRDIDLDFLPVELLNRINSIFDSYFSLGFQELKYNLEEADKPLFPNKISSLDLKEVSDFHALFEAWLGFTRDKLKYFKVARTVLSEKLEEVYNKRLGQLNEAKGNIESKKAIAKSSDDFKIVNSYMTRLEAMIEMMEVEKNKYEGHCMSLRAELKSREINNVF